MKRFLIFLAFVSFVYPYTRPRYGGELRLELIEGGNILSWDYLIYKSLLYSNIFFLDKSGKPNSYIFSSWYEEEGKWHFRLRDGLLYNDSTPVLPQDVANSIANFIRGNLPGSISLSRFVVSVGIKPPDEIIIETSKSVNLPLLLSTPYLFLEKQGKFSGPFFPAGDVLKANTFFFAGRPFLDRIRVVSPPEEFDLGKVEELGKVPVDSRSYMVYLIVSPKYWRKLSRRAIFTFLSSLPWKKRADSYLPPALSQFSLDFPVVRMSRLRSLIRKKLIIAIPPLFSSLMQEIETLAETNRIKAEVYLSSDPLGDLLKGKANAVLLPSQAVFVGSEAEELLGMMVRFKLPAFFSSAKKVMEKLNSAFEKNEEERNKIIASAYEYIASREFFFPMVVVNEKLYLSKDFVYGGTDFYGRPIFWKIRRKITSGNEGNYSSVSKTD